MATSLDLALVDLLSSIEVFGLGDSTGRTGTASITLGPAALSSDGGVRVAGASARKSVV